MVSNVVRPAFSVVQVDAEMHRLVKASIAAAACKTQLENARAAIAEASSALHLAGQKALDLQHRLASTDEPVKGLTGGAQELVTELSQCVQAWLQESQRLHASLQSQLESARRRAR